MSEANNSPTKICPRCREEITARAIKCRHCGEVVEQCNYHPIEAIARCSKCGMFLCGDCTRAFEKHKFCPYCYSQVKTGLEQKIQDESENGLNPNLNEAIGEMITSGVYKPKKNNRYTSKGTPEKLHHNLSFKEAISSPHSKIVEESAPVYCRMCGKNLNEQAKRDICLGCGVKAGVGNNFCPNCGTATNPLAVLCVKCGVMFEDFKYPVKSDNRINNANIQNKRGYDVIADAKTNEGTMKSESIPQKGIIHETVISLVLIGFTSLLNIVDYTVNYNTINPFYELMSFIAFLAGVLGMSIFSLALAAIIPIFFMGKGHKHKYIFYFAIIFLICSVITFIFSSYK